MSSNATPTPLDRRILSMHHILWEDDAPSEKSANPGWFMRQNERLTRQLGLMAQMHTRLRQERDAWRFRCRFLSAALLIVAATEAIGIVRALLAVK